MQWNSEAALLVSGQRLWRSVIVQTPDGANTILRLFDDGMRNISSAPQVHTRGDQADAMGSDKQDLAFIRVCFRSSPLAGDLAQDRSDPQDRSRFANLPTSEQSQHLRASGLVLTPLPEAT
jgi:hypothetical protein